MVLQDVQTLLLFNATALAVNAISYWSEPAAWNYYLPQLVRSGPRVTANLELYGNVGRGARAEGVLRWYEETNPDGCNKLPSAPKAPPSVIYVRRGRCPFLAKARIMFHRAD